jgi:virginiamycin A acetyltransferase
MFRGFKKVLFNIHHFLKNPIFYLINRIKVIGNKNEVSITAKGIKHLELGHDIKIPEFCFFAGQVKIGDFTTLGIHNFFSGNIEIGKYCQIGGYVAIHSTNHPITYPTIYINRNLLEGKMQQFKTSKKVTIGNDVWIGHGASILQGVQVGDGSIIAAGSVVTKNIESYTIVAGNPARPIKKRFSENIITELLELKWWNQPKEFIEKNKTFFFTNLETVTSIKGLIEY